MSFSLGPDKPVRHAGYGVLVPVHTAQTHARATPAPWSRRKKLVVVTGLALALWAGILAALFHLI
jgi:hypothetical protein